MIKNLKNIGIFFLLSLNAYGNESYDFQFALVRELSKSFENSLKLHPPTIPINCELAKHQHENYIQLLKEIVPTVIIIDSDDQHPDCNFIEDTAIIVGDIAVISRMGAIERRGEEVPVEKALENLGVKNIFHIQSPGTMDGGDILLSGKHLLVGLSHRTNDVALNQLKSIFKDKLEVIGIPVIEGLHLKSAVSLFDFETLIVADTFAGRFIKEQIQLATGEYNFVFVPDSVASNVLRIGSTLIVQEGFPASEKILQELCDKKAVHLKKINMSELIKADGALTCGCLLLNVN